MFKENSEYFNKHITTAERVRDGSKSIIPVFNVATPKSKNQSSLIERLTTELPGV